MGRALVGASLAVAAGVAVNQIYDNGKLSWSWGYLALVFTVLGALVQAAQQTPVPSPETASPPPRANGPRKGSRRGYLRRMRTAVDQMETIGLVTQAEYVLRTRQVYVDVMLRPRPVTEVVTDTGIGSVPSTEAGRRASLASFLAPGRVLAVLGAAGSGKTTLVRHTALEIVERRRPGRRQLPVLLYLRDHAEEIAAGEPEGLAQIAVTAPWLNGAVSAEWLEERLMRGRCVVLLDGLDEVADSEARSRVVQWIEAQISRYPASAFVVTSRPAGYDANRLSRADVLQVQRFTSRQIRDFLHSWYQAIEHRSREGDPREIDRIASRAADDLFRRLSSAPTLSDLAANPLLLTMIANVHRYRGSLPGSRVALYEEVCQVLLHRRQEAKNLRDTDADRLSGEKKERIVQELAWYMMRRELRDIPAEEAERAIRTVLERTAPDITPAAFLLHVKRSGLLLEHQYGRYGFAHLTLQEYLASMLVPAHASRRQLLIDNVGNPWWREVTLLWAARADASPVVEACLADLTVTALNLAYACADEARELDPVLRTWLDQLLRAGAQDDDARWLLDGVIAARALQDTHALDDGTRVCTHPVSNDLWTRCLPYIASRHLSADVSDGLWTRDIKDFLAWLNGLFGDGTGYRLPTPAEARQILDRDLFTRRTGSMAKVILYAADQDWADDHGQVRLVPFSPTVSPHRPSLQQRDGYAARILRHTHVLFRLRAFDPPTAFSDLLAFGAPRDLDRPEDRLLHALDLAFQLSIASEAVLAPLRERALEYAVDLGFEDLPDRADDLDLDRLRDQALRYAERVGGELGHDLGPRLQRISAHREFGPEDPADVLFDVLHQFRDNARHAPLAPALDRPQEHIRGSGADREQLLGALDRALSDALERDLADARHLAGALTDLADNRPASDIARMTVRRIDVALGRRPGSAHGGPDAASAYRGLLRNASIDRVLVIDRFIGLIVGLIVETTGALGGIASDADDESARDKARDLYFALRCARHHALALALAKAHPPREELNLAWGLSLARLVFTGDLGRLDMNAVIGTAWACARLERSFLESRWRYAQRSPGRRSRASTVEEYLREELRAAVSDSPAHDPEMALEAALHRADATNMEEVGNLIRNAARLTAPLWDRSRPVREGDLVLAVTSLLAARIAAKEGGSDGELANHLSAALTALIALTPDPGPPPTDPAPLDKLLVLVRA
ncbi:NACHT domain-containing NTPase [Actinomadura sp. K4S16]|uniref:NACHT domain-containing protein n=1 Tax=Actinomadura sp. K4S16 TaxID=1316147 RepID=UPI0011EEB4BB|nr:NACHT domain-containing protein [Actinomadura sp. K4S16]